MRHTEIFKEAKRLWDLGFAIHWLHPKSKRPVESGWTTGPRKEWAELDRSYRAGFNIGVRLGGASKLVAGYLAVVDVDLKSTEIHHRKEALTQVRRLLGNVCPPEVRTGRGNGSRHYYVLTDKPFKTWNPAQSQEIIKVHQPSKTPSKAELSSLTPEEIEKGMRLSHAWEVSLYSDGRQVVLPPSVHPDSGQLYTWKQGVSAAKDIPLVEFPVLPEKPSKVPKQNLSSEGVSNSRFEFEVETVDIGWLPISEEVRAGILEGTGVTDRSGFLLRASSALISAGLSQNEVLSALTDPDTFIGAVGYDHAQTRDRKRAAEWIYRYTLKKVAAERSGENVFGKAADAVSGRKLTPKEQAENEAWIKEERHWTQDLIKGGDNGQGPPQKLIQNVVLILQNAVDPKVIQRDLFAYRDTYVCDTPWGGKVGHVVGDDDVARIKYWLGCHWRFEPNNNTVSDALVEIACQNAYDPVRDILDGLPVWDGLKRLDTWLANHFGATGNPEYLAQVFRKWMFAMVLRVYEPGAKFDWMPIFEGAQGIGKSSFGRLLVGDKYFLDWLPNLNDKDSALSLQGMWGVEMGELSQFRRNELENIKAFITRTVDKLRPPYGRRLIESPRRCVFFGTTNRNTYLIDETGNRRFKPVVVGALDFKALRRERLQLFAEAKHLYDQKLETEMTLELTGEARVYERQIHQEKMVEDDSNAMRESMEDFVEKVMKKRVEFDLQKFRIMELFEGVGPLTKWKPEMKNVRFAAKMLTRLGFEMRYINGLRCWRGADRVPVPGETDTPTKRVKPSGKDDVNFM